MTLEESIRSWFVQSKEIAGQLATYLNMPAVFYGNAPADIQKGWNGDQYPRIVYRIDKRADIERKTAGTIVLDLFCDINTTIPEEIEPLIRDHLKNLIVQPDNDSPYCFLWSRTDQFDLESNNSDKRISGAELLFDILEYPDQITFGSDPVEMMQRFIGESFSAAFVLGKDPFDHFKVPTEDNPAVYVRVDNMEMDHESYALLWLKCKISIHVMAPTASARNKWIKAIYNKIMITGESFGSDGTQFLFTGGNATANADYLINGQITIDTTYIVFRNQKEQTLLNHALFGGEHDGKEKRVTG